MLLLGWRWNLEDKERWFYLPTRMHWGIPVFVLFVLLSASEGFSGAVRCFTWRIGGYDGLGIGTGSLELCLCVSREHLLWPDNELCMKMLGT